MACTRSFDFQITSASSASPIRNIGMYRRSIHLPALTSVSTVGDCEIVVVALRTLAGTFPRGSG